MSQLIIGYFGKIKSFFSSVPILIFSPEQFVTGLIFYLILWNFVLKHCADVCYKRVSLPAGPETFMFMIWGTLQFNILLQFMTLFYVSVCLLHVICCFRLFHFHYYFPLLYSFPILLALSTALLLFAGSFFAAPPPFEWVTIRRFVPFL